MPMYRTEMIRRLEPRFRRLYGEKQVDICLRRARMLIGRYGVGEMTPLPRERWSQATRLLITYADMVQEPGRAPLRTLADFADRRLQSAFSHVHILPFCPYSSDDGFSVIDYRAVNPAYGEWRDIARLGKNFGLMFDLVLNHCSRQSDWFKQFVNGIAPGRHFFIEVDPDTDLSAVTRPRALPLLTAVQTRAGEKHVWTTFSADQVDLDFRQPDVLFEFLDILFFYLSMGARILRLDAIAYLWKTIGTSCIHLPQTHEVVKLMRDLVDMVAPDAVLLTETNVPHRENVSYFGEGDEAHMVYQFSLPPLLLHALLSGDASHLSKWAGTVSTAPAGCTYLNFTASHDGVGVRPLEGIIPDSELQNLVKTVKARGGLVNYKTNPDGSQSPYELNVTYFSALCEHEQPDELDLARFLCSQAIPLALKGVPAVYFHSLTATPNWREGVKQLEYNRAINRRKWHADDLNRKLDDPATPTSRVFNQMQRMLAIRAGHPAFHPDGAQAVLDFGPGVFALERSAPGGDEVILSLSNLTREAQDLDLSTQAPGFLVGTHEDILSGEQLSGRTLRLAPYQTRWVRVGG